MKKNKHKLNLVYLLLAKRLYVYYFTVAFTVLFLLYSFIATPKYVSVGQLLPALSSPAAGSLQLLQGIEFGDDKITRIARAAGLSLGATSGDVLAAVLGSRTIREGVIEQSNLHEHYGIPVEKKDDILRALDDATRIDVTPQDIVIIEVGDRDPEKAKEIVDNYIAVLDHFLKESGMTRGKHERVFMEQRLQEATEALRISEDSLVAFQERHRIIHLPEEIRMGIELYAQLNAARQAKEIELKMKLGYLQKENPEIIELKREISAYDKKLRELEKNSGLEGYGIGSAVSLKDLSNIELDYFRIYRTVQENERIHAYLVSLYEQAKISEARDTPIVTVVDYGAVPQRPEFPKKIRMTIYGFLFGLIFSILYILFTYSYQVFLEKQENKYLYQMLKGALLTDLKNIKTIFKR